MSKIKSEVTMTISYILTCFVSCLLLVSPVQTATITDYFGNVAFDNGTIVWATPPTTFNYKTTNTYDDGGLATLFAFARSFINTIQPKSFPFDLIKQVLNGTFDISGQYMELINYAMGFGICFVLGLLYVVFIPLCGCCFCCCRCCGNCGGDMKQEYDDNEDCKRMGLAQAVFLMAILMTASTACIYVTNDRFTVALNYADGNIQDNLDDITSYSKNTETQFRYVAIDMYSLVADAILRDISGIGVVLAEEIHAVLDIDPVINAVISLDNKLMSIDSALDKVIADQSSLTSATSTMSSSLSTLKSNIDTTKTSCSSDCVPTTACDGFDTSGMTMNSDYSSFPDLTSTQSSIKNVLAKNLTAIALQAKAALDGMEGTITSSTTSIQSNLQSTLDSFKATINTMTDDFVNQIHNTFNTKSLKTQMKDFFTTAIQYDSYRQYFGYGLMALFSMIPIMSIVGILCGCCCMKKDVKPTKRGACQSCGGCLLILSSLLMHPTSVAFITFCLFITERSVAIMFIIGGLLMLLTSVAFMIGGNFEKICQTFLDMTIFKDFIDTGAIAGFSLGSMILNDPSANISIYNLLLGCRENKAPFELMSLNSIIPIDNYLNYSQYLGDIDAQINSISSAVDLSSFQVLTPDMNTSLHEFKNSGIDSINFTAINETLSQSAVTIDFNSMISAMQAIRDLCTGTTRSNWEQHITDMTNIRDVQLPAVETAKSNLQTSVSTLEHSISGVTTNIDNVLATAADADHQIQNNATVVLNDVAQTYKTRILGYIDSYIAETRYLLFYELAACRPLWNLYDSFTTMLCNYTVDALNAFWFATGWGLVLFVPVIIISVKLSKYYRKMKECEGYGDDSDDEDDYDSDDSYEDPPPRYNQVSPN